MPLVCPTHTKIIFKTNDMLFCPLCGATLIIMEDKKPLDLKPLKYIILVFLLILFILFITYILNIPKQDYLLPY